MMELVKKMSSMEVSKSNNPETSACEKQMCNERTTAGIG